MSIKFTVHKKERIYFAIMGIIGAAIWIPLMVCLIVMPPMFLVMFSIYFLCMIGKLFFMGYLRGNAIKITNKQFPDIFAIVQQQSKLLGLKKVPNVYVLQGNGILNAFAMRLTRHNEVILLSTVLEAAYQEGKPAVEFIIGHELGHIVRGHVGELKTLLLLPAKLIPFLGSAYSRACEYTCDNIGYSLCPEGALKGLLILAVGGQLYKKINLNELLMNKEAEHGFAVTISELVSTHPHLLKRIKSIADHEQPSDVKYSYVTRFDTQAELYGPPSSSHIQQEKE